LCSCNPGQDSDNTEDPGTDTNPGEAGNYYVSPNGSDSGSGTLESPWRTIGKAAQTLKAGDTVNIRSGTYNERVVPVNSGNSGSVKGKAAPANPNYITYTAYENESVTIDGSGVSLPGDPDDLAGLFEINNKKYIQVSSLRIINVGPGDNHNGILVNNSSNIVLENNYTYDTASSGIGVWDSNNITLDGNEVVKACNDGEQECITVAITDNFEIKNNHVHDSGPGSIGGEGICTKDGSKNGKVYKNTVHDIIRLGIYIDAWDKHTYNIEVYGNRVFRCKADGIVVATENGGFLENVWLYNNIIYNNDYSGITTADWGERNAGHPMKDIYIINNTIYKNGTQNWGGGIYIANSETENLIVRNNILSENLLFQMAAEVSDKSFITADHNLIFKFIGYEYEITGTDYVTSDPFFVDPGSANFHLILGSGAINTGSSDGAPGFDFDGNIRPSGSGYDIGAFEYIE
jgi:hypothetical protein